MAIINGQITSIDSDIVADIEALIMFADSEGVELRGAVIRVKDYLATYKLTDEYGE